MRGRGTDAQRVAVGSGPHRAADANRARGTSDILDDDRLTETAVHLLGEKSRQGIGGAAGGERHDHADRPVRIILRGGYSA
jgi:hypothetical protein